MIDVHEVNNRIRSCLKMDLDEQDFLKEAWEELEYKNPLIFFKNGEEISIGEP